MKLFNKRKRKHRYINGSKGVISIFLCLIMTPMLSLASALVEFSRYQNTEAIFQEVMDCSSLSTLANYDEYLQKRFGLFAVSQEKDINQLFEQSIIKNSSVMEGMSLSGNINASGNLPLSDVDVIKRQILDYSESTVLTEIILEDLQLQTLLDELDKLMAIGGIADTLNDMNNMTTKIKELVEKGEAFVEKLNGAVTQVGTIKTDANNFTTAIADFYKKITEDGFKLDSTTEESKTASLEILADIYFNDIKDIYDKTNTLISSVTALKDTVTTIPSDFEDLQSAFDAAVEAVNKVTESTNSLADSSNTGSAGQGDGSVAEVSDDSTSLYQKILDSIKTALDDASESLSSSVIDGLKEAANGFADDIVEGLGLDVTKRWDLTSYFSLPLSDEAKRDLEDIISELPAVWEDGSYNGVINTLKEKFIPEVLTMDFESIKSTISSAISRAKETFVEDAKESISDILTKLVNTITGLFDLDVFYDGSLNAYLDVDTINTLLSDTGGSGAEQQNPYVSLLNAITSMISAVESFTNGLTGFDFFAIVDGIINLCTSIKETVEAIVYLTADTVAKIGELIGWVANGEWEKFGELLLMSGYMVHNLPNRTMAGRAEITLGDGSVAYNTVLNGETLTGFPYSDIKTPAKAISAGITANKEDDESSISAVSNFMNGPVSSGSDKMFRGAELEYILAGTQSEVMNQCVVFMQIYFLRLLLDLVPVFTDPAVSTMASAASIACWAVYLIVVFAEPLCDTVLLVNGAEDVCFIKKSCYLTPTGIPKLVESLSSVVINNQAIQKSAVDTFNSSIEGKFDSYKKPGQTFKSGIMPMEYSTHVLLILLFTTTTDDMLRRLANLAQLEANYYYTENGAEFDFNIRKAYTGISASAEVEFDSFIKIFQTNNSSGLVKKQFTRTNTY